mgnify:CR=1 FL=1
MRFKALFNRGETRPSDLLEFGLQPQLLRVATMSDWWAMSREYPEFRKTSTTPLKDFGYLALFHYIRGFRPARILEFGHGFNAALFERFQRFFKLENKSIILKDKKNLRLIIL